ncbi:MAG: hypothetical protein Q7R52_03075 [archaeon]|nr:hypothetical protein [archaeon]
MVKRKCQYCDKIINRKLDDFHEIAWEAVSFNRKKAIVSCPDHHKEMLEYIRQKTLN